MYWLGRTHSSWTCAVAFFVALGVCPGAGHAQGVDALGAPVPPSPSPSSVAAPAAAPSAAAAPGSREVEGAAARGLVVFTPELSGVDARIGAPLEDQLRESGAQLGYADVPSDCVQHAAAQVGLGQPASVSGLWRVLYLCRAPAGLYARVWAENGEYVIELTGALLDGRGPFVQRRRTDHLHFLQTVDALAREVMPVSTASEPAPAVAPSASSIEAFEPTAEDIQLETPAPPVQRVGFAATAESAFGVGRGSFYNQLLGARVDVRLTHEIAVGAYLGYANLRGYQGRVGNLVTYLQLEDRVRLGDRTKLRIPLRFGAGFVPRNGPLVRFAAGLSMPVNDHIEVGVDLLAPTLWVLPEGQLAASLSLALEVIVSP